MPEKNVNPSPKETVRKKKIPLVVRFKEFIGNLWIDDFDQATRLVIRTKQFIRMVIASITKFLSDEAMMRGATISYSLVVSFVPTIVVVLLVGARVINTEEYFAMAKEFVRKNGIPLNLDPYINVINELLKNAAAIGGIGFLIMLFSATSVLRNVEDALNSVFKVKKKRPIIQKFAGFLMVMIFGPVLLTIGITYAQWLLGMFASPDLKSLRFVENQTVILGDKHVYLTREDKVKWRYDNIVKKVDFRYGNEVIVFNVNEGRVLTNKEKARIASRLGYANKSSLNKAAYSDVARIGNRIWVTTNEGTLLRSKDGGQIFHAQRFQREDNGLLYGTRLNRILMLNDRRGIMIGNAGSIFLTADGGDTWEYSPVPGVTAELQRIIRLGSGAIAIVGDNFTALISEDNGATFKVWQAVKSLALSDDSETPAFENITGISQFGQIIALCGDGGLLLVSRDGGASFKRQTMDKGIDFTDIKVINQNLIIAIADNGIIRHTQVTSDGSLQWVEGRSDTDVNLSGIEYLPKENRVIIVGNAYHILANKGELSSDGAGILEFEVIQKSPFWRKLISALGNVILPFVVIWILFFLVYKIIPYTNVTTKAAAIGAATTSLIWVIFLLLFKLYVSSFSKGTFAIYGTLAAVPIALLLVYTSSLIMLYGGEVAYLVQYPAMISQRRMSGKDDTDKRQVWYGLQMLYRLALAFYKGKGEVPEDKLLAVCNNDQAEFNYMINRFVERNFVIRTESKGYALAEDPSLMKMTDIMSDLEATDYSIPSYNDKDPFMKIVKKYMDEVEKSKKDVFAKVSFGDLIKPAL